jgi:hypothetical protein
MRRGSLGGGLPLGREAEIPEPVIRAVGYLVQRLPLADVNWALTGSVAHRLAGAPMPVGEDLDVQTDVESAYEVARRLTGAALIEPVRLRESEQLRSHLGRAELFGVTVEIIGGLQKRSSPTEPWGPMTDPADHRRTVELAGLGVPVLDLGYEADAYEQLGRHERADVLRQTAKRARTQER